MNFGFSLSFLSRPLSSQASTVGSYVLLLFLLTAGLTSGAVSCTNNFECEELFYKGSQCHPETRTCTNPFAAGCLQSRLGPESDYTKRVCNSEDDDSSSKNCVPSEFDYPEIRISTGNWESSMFLAWIFQIYLSEALHVPVSIESGHHPSEGKSCNFYDEHNRFAYGALNYDYGALKEGNRLVDCRRRPRPQSPSDKNWKSCAHVLPEVWNGKQKDTEKAEADGYIEPAEGNGEVGKISWYIPKHTARRDNSLISYFGLQGPENRRKLARTFKRPTTWGHYCSEVSLDNCTRGNDAFAKRPPQTDSESSMYFSGDGNYIGHFRYTDKNDCDSNPDSCTGHIVDAPCGWSTFTESQLFWNNISLDSDGPLDNHGAYSYSQMIQIWRAANATQSDVMMWWWKPDHTIETFRDTDYEFQPVTLPQPTDSCISARVTTAARCSSSFWDRVGEKEGSCDSEAHALQRLVAASLYDSTYSIPEAWRSPAYETLKGFKVSDLSMDTILQAWMDRGGIDMYGYDPRHAVCMWVADNLELLHRYVPVGYPRIMVHSAPYDAWYVILIQSMAALTSVVVMASCCALYKWKELRVMQYPQVEFLSLMLAGFFLLSLGGVVVLIEPSEGSCVSAEWLILLGFTCSLIPLLVKVIVMNKRGRRRARGSACGDTETSHGGSGGGVSSGSSTTDSVHGGGGSVATPRKRGYVAPRLMIGTTFGVLLVSIIYLSVWTALDAPQSVEDRQLQNERSNIVEWSMSCQSSTFAWDLVVVVAKLVVLVCTTVLGFQARNSMLDFHESRTLASMVYVHLLFTVLGVIMFFLSGKIRSNVQAALFGLFLTCDVLLSLFVYYVPKFLVAYSGKDPINEAALSQELQKLIHTATTPIFGVDSDGKINEWNDKMAASTGYSEKEALKKHFVNSFVLPHHRRYVQRIIDDALNMGKGVANHRADVKSKSDETRHMLFNVTPRRNSENRVVGVLVVAQDVTESARHERSVGALRREYRNLIDQAHAPVFGVDVHGWVNEWNSMMEQVTGYGKKEALGKPLVRGFVDPAYRDRVQEILDGALQGKDTASYKVEFLTKPIVGGASGGGGRGSSPPPEAKPSKMSLSLSSSFSSSSSKPASQSSTSSSLRQRAVVQRKRLFMVNATTKRDEEQKITGALGVAQDMTEAARQASRCQNLTKQMHNIMESANAPVLGIDARGRVNVWNHKMVSLTGYAKRDVMGKSLTSNFVVPSRRQSVRMVLEDVLHRGKETTSYEMQLMTKGGNNGVDSVAGEGSKEGGDVDYEDGLLLGDANAEKTEENGDFTLDQSDESGGGNPASGVIFLAMNATARLDQENNIVGVMGFGHDVTLERTTSQSLRQQEMRDEMRRSLNRWSSSARSSAITNTAVNNNKKSGLSGTAASTKTGSTADISSIRSGSVVGVGVGPAGASKTTVTASAGGDGVCSDGMALRLAGLDIYD